jgi:quinol monooxygenase YgiN
MSVVRLGELQARDGQAQALLEYLEQYFVPSIQAAEGCTAYLLLRRQDDPNRILILEVWETQDAHRASAKSIPVHVLEQVRQLLAASPSGAYYDIIRSSP